MQMKKPIEFLTGKGGIPGGMYWVLEIPIKLFITIKTAKSR
jgi:hypothetical protein